MTVRQPIQMTTWFSACFSKSRNASKFATEFHRPSPGLYAWCLSWSFARMLEFIIIRLRRKQKTVVFSSLPSRNRSPENDLRCVSKQQSRQNSSSSSRFSLYKKFEFILTTKKTIFPIQILVNWILGYCQRKLAKLTMNIKILLEVIIKYFTLLGGSGEFFI